MRACPVRTGAVRRSGGAPTNEPATASCRRSTRLGCECVPAPFAPRAVLLQTHLPPPRIVGAPAPGANVCLLGSHRGGAPTNTPATTSYRRSTRLGCECVLDRFAPGAVLLQTHLPPPRVVGAPAPGANVCLPDSHRGRCSYNKPATTSYRRSTRAGCECVPAPFAPGAVLLRQASHHPVS